MGKLYFKRENKKVTITQDKEKQTFSTKEIKEILNKVRHPFEIAICGNGTKEDENYFNSAAVIRSGHNFLVEKIHLIDRPAFYKRATMGTHGYENIEFSTLNEFLEKYSKRNIVSFERRTTISSENLYYFQYPEKPILVFGTEKYGVPDKILEASTNIVSIEQYGLHNDLNVAIAASVAMYDWLNKHYRRDK